MKNQDMGPETKKSDPRLRLLHRAIEGSPNAPVNYVFRGEYWLQKGSLQAAITDFETAITLATQQREDSDWGYLEQALIDRARQGLRLARTSLTQQ
ncbi:MAG: hypothetical protein GYB66_09260 [Chloroflexi bacterium]|nr:hypothetical protein [Chloroflexota bacterium]